jgi:UDP-2,3-diacylglucosamine pyrophosphatase LpxH
MMKVIALVLGLSMALVCMTMVNGCANVTSNRNEIVVISDIHLGADDAFAEMKENKEAFLVFLKEIRASKTIAELVVNGDLIDQWFLPMNYEMPETLSEFNDLVATNNQEIFDEINGIITDRKIKVTYVPGNHDINLDQAETERLFPGIHQARDAEGLGTYLIGSNDIAIEHGHRYNFFVAPDPLSNRDIVKSEKSILPCGYFFTRIATSDVVEGQPNTSNTFSDLKPNAEDTIQMAYYYYFMNWKFLLTALPVSESFSDKVIKTHIDGYFGTFAISDLIPFQNSNGDISVSLYNGIVENWDERQTINRVNVPINLKEAVVGAASNEFTDLQASMQYATYDPTTKLVVFGHTHEAKISKMTHSNGNEVVYANSGTWIDHVENYPTRTYLLIKRSDKEIIVELYRVDDDGTSIKLSEERIIK